MENLMGFVHHLHFFLGIFIVKEDVDLGYHIVSNLVMLRQTGRRKDFRFIGLPLRNGCCFIQKLINAILTCTGNSLVGAYDDSLDSGNIINRL